jgi:membrane protease subunit HflK
MAERPDHLEPTPDDSLADSADVPVEPDELAEETPRRAASAEFVVDAQTGSHALLREAMDPANQSLREALRLSFRVLQVVILILIVLFVFSGFQTVEEGQTGVMLRWGRILGEPGEQALEPGLKFSKWPYPAGEFVLFRDQGRPISVDKAFWPLRAQQMTFEQAVEQSRTNDFLRPGLDGSLLTAEGDIVHIQLRGAYDIDDPVAYIRRVENDNSGSGAVDGDELVKLALERATVHVAARLPLREFVEFGDPVKDDLRDETQAFLARIGAGIRIARLEAPANSPTPALAIRRAYGDLEELRGQIGQSVVKAREEAGRSLIDAAGENHDSLLALIDQYEDAVDLGESARADALLTKIDEQLESPQTGGEAALRIITARSYRADIERTLGRDLRRFRSLLPAYRENPQLIVSKQWTATLDKILNLPDTEIIRVPGDLARLRLAIRGSDDVRNIRRDELLKRHEKRGTEESFAGLRDENRLSDRERRLEGKPGRQLSRNATAPGGE